ncbi:MAG: response regulator [Kiritimatiellia bacterium]|jgi:FixJ family two-component response regulator|nr:response regulator [Kiritimatiellia bacterium]MDP6630325.1 response regulator [Kiritimatiellia bacterium]MDP6810832.1 response regulator [Kiritimatiellia bacterium]MDP7024174.1 response regulator [Kiritimatiellia bacterium]
MPANVQYILVVDDDAGFRSSTRRLFWILTTDAIEFKVREAGSGEEALEVLNTFPVDCVLIDNIMPGGSGLEWIPRLVALHPNLPVIMMTGNGDESTAVAAMKQGAIDYLVKGDVTPTAIGHAVSNAIERTQMAIRLERQQEELVAAEKDRVMMRSLGSACHHLGQPATALATLLELIRRRVSDPVTLDMLDQSGDCMDTIRDTLNEFRTINHYQTEAYLAATTGDPQRVDTCIVALKQDDLRKIA